MKGKSKKYSFSVFIFLIISFLPIRGQNLSIGAGFGGFYSYVYMVKDPGISSTEFQNYKSIRTTPFANILFEPWVTDSVSLRIGIFVHQLRYEYEINHGDRAPGPGGRRILITYQESANFIDVDIPLLLSVNKRTNSKIFRFETGPYLRQSFSVWPPPRRTGDVDFNRYSGGLCLLVSGGSKYWQVCVLSSVNLTNNLKSSFYSEEGKTGNFVFEFSVLREFTLKRQRD